MVLNVRGKDIEVCEYDLYLQYFKEIVKPEYAGEAETYLYDAVARCDMNFNEEEFCVSIDSSKTVSGAIVDLNCCLLYEDGVYGLFFDCYYLETYRFNRGSVNYKVNGFGIYVEDFKKFAKPEYAGEAENILWDSLEASLNEEINARNGISVLMPEEKSKYNCVVSFHFSVTLEDGFLEVNYLYGEGPNIYTNVKDVEYEILNIDEYLTGFEGVALAEYRHMGYDMLINSVEKWREEHLECQELVLDAEKTKEKIEARFVFRCIDLTELEMDGRYHLSYKIF